MDGGYGDSAGVGTVGRVYFVLPLVTVIVVLALTLAVRARRQKAGKKVSPVPVKWIVAYFVVTGVVLGVQNWVDGARVPAPLRHSLAALPALLYLAFALGWLIQHRREIVAGWKAESAEDRDRGLTGKKRK